MRIGMGYDVHKLVEKRKLVLGGVEIPYELPPACKVDALPAELRSHTEFKLLY